jgi:hypothetical protein
MSYANSKYGLKRRIIFPNVDAIGTAAVHPDCVSFPTKTKIIKFGLMAQDNDVRVSSDTILDLITPAGTLAQFTFSTAAVVAATDIATGKTLTTATTVAANTVLQGAVGVIGSSGNFQYYIDVQEQFDVADAA